MANTQNASNENQTGFQSLNNATGAMTGRTITAGSSALTVTNGNGITGNPTITLTSPVSLSNGGTGTSAILTQGSIVYTGASGVYTGDSTLLTWVAPSGPMVVGGGSSAADGSRFIVSCNSSSFRGISLTGTLSSVGAGNTQYGFFLNPTLSPGSAPLLSTGMAILPNFSSLIGSSTDNASGLYISNNPTGNAGTLSNLYGVYIASGNSGSGTITNAYGLFVKKPAAGTSRYTAIIGDTGSDIIGFGTSTPHPQSLITATQTSQYGIILNGTVTALDPDNCFGIFCASTYAPTTDAMWMSSIITYPSMAIPTGKTASQVAGISSSIQYTGNAGTITNSYGILVDSGGSGSGTITNTYGGCFKTPTAGTNKVALYADSLNVGQIPNTQNTSGVIQYTNRLINTSASQGTVYAVVYGCTGVVSYASGAGLTIIKYDNKIYDPANSYNTSSGLYTAPCSGIYFYYAQFAMSTNGTAIGRFLTSSNTQLGVTAIAQTNGATTIHIPISGLAYLNGGTQYKFEINPGIFTSGNVSRDTNDYMSIALITATS